MGRWWETCHVGVVRLVVENGPVDPEAIDVRVDGYVGDEPCRFRLDTGTGRGPIGSCSWRMSILVVSSAGRRGTLPGVSDSSLAVGRRIVVTGLAGSGKSTFTLALAEKTGLPVIHLDLAFWKPGWVAPSETEWRAKQNDVLAGDAWIADGNYHETLDLRIARAETVVVLDLPWWLCSARALRRGFTMPDQLPEGCPYSRWARWRDEWRLAGRVWRDRNVEPARERAIIADHSGGIQVHVLRSRRSVHDFLSRVHA